ncbi:hypothetical protein VSR01_10910 [Actinacidiphila sp. DG2A-62]|uniref:hypothetical protein n=1 Tax=Actinacidiphila sp. DG2A-62 TaxID=3108821 RepID=UPI002DB8D37D|nr:hypothetical protein [Actinacidiphila sp. DG2A-62]MEC3994029.1 hypothetical protein [Actinacidiphila sp. DG2A-62]
MLTIDDIRKAREAYDAEVKAADDRRALVLAQASAEGMPQTDVIAATGYSRETVRRITRQGQHLAQAMTDVSTTADHATRAVQAFSDKIPQEDQ